jgi:tRNA(Ile)-lysidine synthase
MDLKKLERYAIEQCKLVMQKPLLAGVSGGADSLCLADSLHRCGFTIIIAHFDHRLRPTSGKDAKFVEAYSKSRGIPFLCGSEDVRDFCKQNSLSIEEGAREARYRFLFEHARRLKAQAVATGHTADDQAETVLMHFLRGSGVSGLKGMKPSTILAQFDPEIPLSRPLLQTYRQETEQFCAQNGIDYLQDESNSDPTFFRNRLRLELLPLLETYQPGIRDRLGRTSRVMADVEVLLSSLVEEALGRVLLNDGPGFRVLSLAAFRGEKIAIQRELLRRVIHDLRENTRDVDFASIERIFELIQSPQIGKRVEVMDGLEAILSPEGLIIKDHAIEIIFEDQFWMPPEESIEIARTDTEISIGNFRIEFSGKDIDPGMEQKQDFSDPQKAILDMETCQFPLILRTRQNADRILPFGMKGHSMKLSDFWVNTGVPRAARGNWPLICDQQGICWIPGFRIMHPYRLTESTRKVLEMRISRI